MLTIFYFCTSIYASVIIIKVTGAITSGLTGSAVTHSDIGGYNVNTNTSMNDSMYFVRTPELLKRWTEVSAFGFGKYFFVFRCMICIHTCIYK